MNIFTIIKQKVLILDIVQEYTTLKKAGSYLKGQCPFHSEKTASFTVSPDKAIFYCFGCHETGDVIAFIAKIENCSQFEAAKILAERYQIPIDTANLEQGKNDLEKKNKYSAICSFFAQWCHDQLIKNIANEIAKNYLKSRQILTSEINEFQLGYFPMGQTIIKQLLKEGANLGFMAQDFINSNILFEGKGLYSPFENRIIFPIWDHLGRTCGFGGRIFQQNDDRAKYYNSHEHEYFNKGTILYGLNKAKKAIQERNCAFLVEGYTDLIAMVHHGYTNTIATLGTACTQEHLKQLSKYAQKLYVVYDGDAAGQKAILRLLNLCWQVSIELYVIILPLKEDPASFLNNNGEMDKLINEANDIFTFFINFISKDFNKMTLQDRLQATKQFINIIEQLNDPIKQEILLKLASQKFDIPVSSLKNSLKPQVTATYNSQIESPDKIETTKNEITLLEKKLFSAILSYDGVISIDDENLLSSWLPKEFMKFFQNIINLRKNGKKLEKYPNLDDIVENEAEKQFISKIIIESETDGSIFSFNQLLLLFYKKKWKFIVQEMKQKLKACTTADAHTEINEMLQNFETMKKKMLLKGIHE